MAKYSLRYQKDARERAKFEKNRYSAHNFRGIVVMGEAFETLALFKEFARAYGLQVSFSPLNVASSMLRKTDRVLTPDQYREFVGQPATDLDQQENAEWESRLASGTMKQV